MSVELIPSFAPDGEAFERVGYANGSRYWHASAFVRMLGYDSIAGADNAINRAIGTLTTLGISVADNFQQCQTPDSQRDYKLSRFACYLIAMNGDVRKPSVAAAQAYFASLAEAARQYIQASQDVERVQIRDDISEREKGLTSTAKQAGVTEYQFFQNAGYRGMYNMNLRALKVLKKLPNGRTLLDFMDKRELAGNLFRITETEAKLKSEMVRGQKPAERVAHDVGRKVRKIMIDNTGTAPENLPLVSDIKDVKKGLKETAREFTKLDNLKNLKR